MTEERKNAYRAAYMQRVEWLVRAMEEDCDSELERLFALALLHGAEPGLVCVPTDMRGHLGGNRLMLHTEPASLWPAFAFGDSKEPCVPFGRQRHVRACLMEEIWIVPQMEIRAGGKDYRADFAFLPEKGSLCPPFVIELDGHAFHERTKEQATRDRARDRAMQTCGWQVVRFTGSELWRDPARCVRDVYAAMLWEYLRRGSVDWGYLRTAFEVSTVPE